MSQLVIQTIHQVLVYEFRLPVELRFYIQQFTCIELTSATIKHAIDVLSDPKTKERGLLQYGIFWHIPLPKREVQTKCCDIVYYYLTSSPETYIWKHTEVRKL